MSAESEGIGHRDFFVGANYGIWAVIAAASGLPAWVYPLLPPQKRKEPEWTLVGDTARLPHPAPVEMAFRRNRVDGWKIVGEKRMAWVVKHADRGVVAFGPQGTRLGCAYHWVESRNEFLYPCHSSLFSLDGTVLPGPAPRPLDRYETRIKGTELLPGRLRRFTGQASRGAAGTICKPGLIIGPGFRLPCASFCSTPGTAWQRSTPARTTRRARKQACAPRSSPTPTGSNVTGRRHKCCSWGGRCEKPGVKRSWRLNSMPARIQKYPGRWRRFTRAVADHYNAWLERYQIKGGLVRTTILTVLVLAGAAVVHSQTPVVPSGSVVNGASFASGQAVAPGALVSIFGTNLASTNAQADSIPLSTSMANVSVTFNGVPAPMLAINHLSSYDQINTQLPWNVLPGGAQSGTAQVVVTNGAASSTPTSLQVVASAPGIFSIAGTGTGQARALNNSDGTFAAPSGSVPGFTTHPAKIGDPNGIAIFATGLGLGDHPVDNGGIPTTLTNVVAVPTVLVGNVPAQVLFAGMSPQFVGVNQINIVLAPGTPTGNAVPLQLQVAGIVTTSQVTIAVSQ